MPVRQAHTGSVARLSCERATWSKRPLAALARKKATARAQRSSEVGAQPPLPLPLPLRSPPLLMRETCARA
jgi:hypothetical protein